MSVIRLKCADVSLLQPLIWQRQASLRVETATIGFGCWRKLHIRFARRKPIYHRFYRRASWARRFRKPAPVTRSEAAILFACRRCGRGICPFYRQHTKTMQFALVYSAYQAVS